MRRWGILQELAEALPAWLQLAGEVALQLDGIVIFRVSLDNVRVSRQKAVQGKGASLTIVVGAEDDECVFDGDNQGQRPDDDGQGANQVIP